MKVAPLPLLMPVTRTAVAFLISSLLAQTTAFAASDKRASPISAPSPAAAIAVADAPPYPAPGGNGSLADGFAGVGQSIVDRTVTLRQLGVSQVDPLDTTSSVREYYFPVPEGVPLHSPYLHFAGDYLRGDGGRTTLVMSLDGSPVSSRAISESRGDAGLTLGVSGAARDSGYLRFGVRWWTVLDMVQCLNQPFRGNILHVDTGTQLHYQYDTQAIRDLRGAWSALPRVPVIAVDGNAMPATAFDAAWRTGALLERDGISPQYRAFPKSGDTVDLSKVTVPASLRSIPAFAALNGTGSHTLANDAEAAAWLVVGSAKSFQADFVVMDDALRSQLDREAQALRAQAITAGAQAAQAFDGWHDRALRGLTAPLEPGQSRVAHLAGQAIMVLADRQAVDTFSTVWRPIDASNNLTLHAAWNPTVGQDDKASASVGLSVLSVSPSVSAATAPQYVAVQRAADWSALFDLGAVSAKGRLPRQVVLDLAGTPDSENTPVVASVFMNDNLIGAQLLNTNGQPQRLTIDIPQFTLRARSQLRIHFERESNTGCRQSDGNPVAILPTSHLLLSKATPAADFTGMAARFADGANVIVPADYLAHPIDALARVARVAAMSAVSPHHATLSVVAAGQQADVSGTFLAMDVPLSTASDAPLQLSDDRMKVAAPDGRVVWDASGIGQRADRIGKDAGVGLVDVERHDGHDGIVYRHAGPENVSIGDNVDLGPGNAAVFDHNGLLKGLDTAHLNGIDSATMQAAGWARVRLSWIVPLALLLAFVLLVLVAAIARRRAQKRREREAAERALKVEE